MDLLRALFGSRCSLSEPLTLSPGDDPPPPLPPLLTLPADALVHLCTSLSVEDLSRLSLVIGGLPDEVWRHSLRSWIARVDRFGCDSGDDLEAWLEEAAAALVVSGGAGDRPLRALVNRLRPLLCAVCDEGEASQVFFAASRQGACERCASERPLELERWRRAQCVREARALALQDEASRAELEAALRDVLPLPAGGSRLLFSSDRHGGSATALLRAARDEPCSVVLVTERPRASSAAAAERRAFGAFVATAWPRAAGEGRRWFGDARCCLFGIAPRVVGQRALSRVVKGGGGLSHGWGGSLVNDRKTADGHGFMEGDLMEAFLDWPPRKKEEVVAGLDMTAEQLSRVIEQLARLH
ncbi:hypothetical protein EMIHUDRAFT_105330 [Emiliania huxleyi CCMP1516]|uniref:TLDc domain-containing protein n=2 Tax=Emiliania huxleyi TaxID=2903 RepID=A0A0D3IG80_EMIH1|nr:hypothetical protein EMIHUDRAFT_105330 [Emiliania huxleyi CCMP1516]EOD10265.1 hypothetical protein EMIHUDRAFT_105330 [Emiliania huxleyi CCMP1516]|eukprot:XP_005762694.1 hypothetical protein EMIHUDRAFT_105330 [Emiliania huxleyi CCMP1516]